MRLFQTDLPRNLCRSRCPPCQHNSLSLVGGRRLPALAAHQPDPRTGTRRLSCLRLLHTYGKVHFRELTFAFDIAGVISTSLPGGWSKTSLKLLPNRTSRTSNTASRQRNDNDKLRRIGALGQMTVSAMASIMDFVQRFDSLQKQRQSSDEIIKVSTAFPDRQPYCLNGGRVQAAEAYRDGRG